MLSLRLILSKPDSTIDAAVALGYRPTFCAGVSRGGTPSLVTPTKGHLTTRRSDDFFPLGKDIHDLSMQRM
jgi:hypothetical protein